MDAESIGDVDFYLRDGLAGIKTDFSDVTIPEWPPEEQIAELSEKASGHFGFAWTSLRYIGGDDQGPSGPMSRLNTLLSFLRGVSAAPSNPLEALDALYIAILDEVPKDVLVTTMQVLGFFIFLPGTFPLLQVLCNFLHIDQATFYNAFRKLHSVIAPKFASQKPLRFYHASFKDYLCDPARSGKYAINEDDVRLTRAKLYLSWYKIGTELFHTADGPLSNKTHKYGPLPGLSWASDDNREQISSQIANGAETECWFALRMTKKWDEALLSQIRNFDFRYIRMGNLDDEWCGFLNRLWESDSSSGIIRTEPHTETDLRLLEYMKSVVGPLWHGRPATFPLETESVLPGAYFFLGYGSEAVICWAHDDEYFWCSVLNTDQPPSKEWIDAYQAKFKYSDTDNSGM